MTHCAYEVLKTIKEFHKKHKQFPRFEYIEKVTKLKKPQIQECLRELEEEEKITRKYSHYFLLEEEHRKTKGIQINNIFVFKVLSVIIGSIAAYLSIYFTFLWFNTMFHPFYAILMSIAIVGFSITSFDSIIIFHKKKNYFILSVFVFLWAIVLIFSMVSTVAGQYNKIKDKDRLESKTNLVSNNKIELFKTYEEDIADLNIEIDSIRVEREKLKEFLSNYTEVNKKYKNLNYRIALKSNIIVEMKKKIDELKNKKIEIIKENINVNEEKEISFFKQMEGIVKIKAAILQFILAIFPAIFFDVVAPLSFGIVFFLKK